MTSIRFAHCADVHMGAGYVHGDEDTGGINSRLWDFRDAWVRSCKDMVKSKVDLVLFAGDAYRDAKPSQTEQAFFRAGLDVLADAGIPVVMVLGNHDQPRQIGRKHTLKIFDQYANVIVMDRPGVVANRDGTSPVPRFPDVAIACFPYPMRAHAAAKQPGFDRMTIDEQNATIAELSMDVLRGLGAEAVEVGSPNGCILVGHMTIAGSTIGAAQTTAFLREPVLALPELSALPFRYQAWGHLHKAQTLAPLITYSGSMERVDFAEADEDKGWWLVEFQPDGRSSTREWRSSGPRPFVDVTFDAEQETLAGVVADGAVVRVSYTATPEVAKTVDNAAIREGLLKAGAVKVHGPFVKIIRHATEKAEGISEDADILTGWQTWADRQGISGKDRKRLDDKVQHLVEVHDAT